jgi:Family of unknown function (DUF6524)
MVASARLTLGGFLARFAFAVLVVGATYNPTPYSYYAWVKSTGYEWRPPTVFGGVVLLIGWFICLRLALRSMGGPRSAACQRIPGCALLARGQLGLAPRREHRGRLVARPVQRRWYPGRRHVLDALAPAVGRSAGLIAREPAASMASVVP